MATIHDDFEESVSLARTYAEDGAFHSASRVLQALAGRLKRHAQRVDSALKAAMEG